MTAKVILHLKEKDLVADLGGWNLELYAIIRDLLARDKIELVVRPRDLDITVGTRKVEDHRFNDGNLHIIDDRSVRMPNVLNAGVAYFWGFWHLDPMGVGGFSSIGGRTYDPTIINPANATQFVNRLRARYSDKRESRYGQPSARAEFPTGAVSVFYQGHIPRNAGITRFSDLDMLKVVLAHAGDRPIIVKPHPLVPDPETNQETLMLARSDPRVTVTDANVHDILTASALTVSINSTVALEGFLHGVPAILFGQSDFHHVAGTIVEPGDFPRLMAEELARNEPYHLFFAWYFLRNCLWVENMRLHDKIWRIFTQAGFPKSRFS